MWFTLRKMRSNDLGTRAKAFAASTADRNVEALLRVVEDSNQYVRSDAIKALGEIGDVRAVPALVKRLEDTNHNNQEAAAAALAKIGDARAIVPLLAMLRDSRRERQTRHYATEALKKIGDSRAVPVLLDALQDQDTLSQSMALSVLAGIGDGRCVPSAIAALRSPDHNVQWGAVAALGAFRDGRAVAPLLSLLREEEQGSWLFREAIITALGRIGDDRAAPALTPLLSAKEESTRKTAAEALDALGWRPTDDNQRGRYFMARQSLDKLVRLGWEQAREPLLETLQHGDNQSKHQAIVALGMFNERPASETLILALKDGDPDVAQAAATTLAKVGGAYAVKPLIDHCLSYEPEGDYRNNPQAPYGEKNRAARWVLPLEEFIQRVGGSIAPEDLRSLLALSNKTYHLSVEYDTPGYGDGRDEFTIVLDFSKVKSLAEKESRRRGLPIN